MSTIGQCYIYSDLSSDPEFEEAIAEFVTGLQDWIFSIERLRTTGKWSEIGLTTGRLRAAAKEHGFSELLPQIAQLQEATRSGQDPEEIRRSLERLSAACRRVRIENE